MQHFDRLSLCSLAPEQRAKTCGYWYTVQSNNTPHTAFRSLPALYLWLGERGLEMTAGLPTRGEHSYQHLVGHYSTRHILSAGEFALLAREGYPTADLRNGDYRRAIITIHPDGSRVVNVAHYDGAEVLDYQYFEQIHRGRWFDQHAKS